jgi:two-component sensor histidine kinase
LDEQTERAKPKRDQLGTLRAIGRALNSAWALEPTLDLISRKTTQVMGVDSCSIYLLQRDGEQMVLKATTGLAHEAIGIAKLRLGEGLTGWAAQEGVPVAERDAAADPRFKLLPETKEKGLRSLAAVPLINQGRVIGAMNVQTAPFHIFAEDEIELLSLIGDLAAGALEKAALHDDMQRQIKELTTLAEVSQAVTSPLYLDEMLGVVVEMATQVMSAKVCSLMLLDENGEDLVPVATQNQPPVYGKRPNVNIRQGIAGQVARTGKPVTVADVRADPTYLIPDLAKELGLISLLSVPLTVRDKVIGVFDCYTGEPHTFTRKEEVFFQTLANQTALAIENARLVAGSVIVREMHHRVKNNLQTIAMLLRLQMSEVPNRPAVEVLPEAINRILAIATVHETLSESGLRFVQVKKVLRQIASIVVQNLSDPNKALRVTVEGDEIVLSSQAATALALAVNELIQNALEHAFQGRATGTVKIALREEEDVFFITVADDGIGLAEGAVGGPSLGLEIVQTLVAEDLKGSFTLRPAEVGTTATIRLPYSATQ